MRFGTRRRPSPRKTNLVQAKATPSNVEDDEIAENKEENAEQKKRFGEQ